MRARGRMLFSLVIMLMVSCELHSTENADLEEKMCKYVRLLDGSVQEARLPREVQKCVVGKYVGPVPMLPLEPTSAGEKVEIYAAENERSSSKNLTEDRRQRVNSPPE